MIRKTLLRSLLGLFCASVAFATCDPTLTPTYTTRAGIPKPVINSCSWGTTTNSNWDLMDSSAAFQATTNTFLSTNTFNQPLIIASTAPLRFMDTSTHFIELRAGPAISNQSITLPVADGAVGQVLRTDGAGNWSWVTTAGGGASTLGVRQSSVTISSPTVALNFIGPPFSVTLVSGNTAQINLDVSSVTLQGNNFNQANQLVKLDGSSKLPAVDGSNLTNFPNGGIVSPGTFTWTNTKGISLSTISIVNSSYPAGKITLTPAFGVGVASVLDISTSSMNVAGNGTTFLQIYPPGGISAVGNQSTPLVKISSGNLYVAGNAVIVSSVTIQGTFPILSTSTLQSGATIYVSTGTILTLNTSGVNVRNGGTVQMNPGSQFIYLNSDGSGIGTISASGSGGTTSLSMGTGIGSPNSFNMTDDVILGAVASNSLLATDASSIIVSTTINLGASNVGGTLPAARLPSSFSVSTVTVFSTATFLGDVLIGTSTLPTVQSTLAVITHSTDTYALQLATSPTASPLVSVSTIPAINPADFKVKVSSGDGSLIWGVQYNSHMVSSGTIPSPGSCGTSPAVNGGSTDNAGSITWTGAATTCAVTFAKPYATAPFCVAVTNGASFCEANTSATAMNWTLNASLSGGTLTWFCMGASGL